MVGFGESKKVSTPFGAVVGQEGVKQALLVAATDPELDGVLVRGEKGTAKSTLVRGLAALFPEQRAVADCPYGCPPRDRTAQCADCRDRATLPVASREPPLVTLPLGATRERVVGTLSVADALGGEASFDPGLLAQANRGLLYVDEVNLLDDHLVDVLLDAAATGVNRIERDGVSRTHPARFTLVGTMNPEEGDLRPQLRDRFALSVTATGSNDLDERVAVMETALGERDGDDGTDYAAQLERARTLLPTVDLPAEFKTQIAELCRDAGVDGHRADIATARAARALAALDGRTRVVESDVRRAAELALPHRLRADPFDDARDPDELLDDHFDDEDESEDGTDGDDSPTDEQSESGRDGSESEGEPDGGDREEEEQGEQDERDRPAPATNGAEPGETAPAETGGGGETDADGDKNGDGDTEGDGDGDSDEQEEGVPLLPGQAAADIGEAVAPSVSASESTPGSGSRAGAAASSTGRGSRVRTERADPDGPVDAAASVRAAATRGSTQVGERDLRRSVRTGCGGALVVFCVDASASMRPAMRAAKGVVLDLLRDAYEQRDRVAFVAFAGDDAEVLLPPTDSVGRGARHLKELPTGDRTPLPAGLDAAAEVIDRADPDAAAVVVVSDGRANADAEPTRATREAAKALAAREPEVVVVDAGDGDGLLGEVAAATGGHRVPLDALTPERVAEAVETARR